MGDPAVWPTPRVTGPDPTPPSDGVRVLPKSLCFIDAVGSHLRVRDPTTNAAIPLVLAIAALTVRLATI